MEQNSSKNGICLDIENVNSAGIELHSQGRRNLKIAFHNPNRDPIVTMAPYTYLAEYQFWAHFASTARSTLRKFLPPKGLDMQSTTMALATSADSVGPSKITSSWTCVFYNGTLLCNGMKNPWKKVTKHDNWDNLVQIKGRNYISGCNLQSYAKTSEETNIKC